jgi:ABC-type arginine transport system permease subunit
VAAARRPRATGVQVWVQVRVQVWVRGRERERERGRERGRVRRRGRGRLQGGSWWRGRSGSDAACLLAGAPTSRCACSSCRTAHILRLYQGCTKAVPWLYHGCTKAVPRLYHGCTMAVPTVLWQYLLYYGSTYCTMAVPTVLWLFLLYYGCSYCAMAMLHSMRVLELQDGMVKALTLALP